MTSARDSSVADCALLELPGTISRAGNLTVLQWQQGCPFKIRRVYYLFDVPAGAVRGGHAHRDLHQLVVAASGSFEVVLDDGRECRTVMLNRPDRGLHLVPGIWRELQNFSSGSICLVAASEKFDERDYWREHSKFLEYKLEQRV
jgi:hypothetical protein